MPEDQKDDTSTMVNCDHIAWLESYPYENYIIHRASDTSGPIFSYDDEDDWIQIPLTHVKFNYCPLCGLQLDPSKVPA